MRGYELMNNDDLTAGEVFGIFKLVTNPNLKMSRRDYQASLAEDYSWLFCNDPICGPTFAMRELMRLACVGSLLEDKIGQKLPVQQLEGLMKQCAPSTSTTEKNEGETQDTARKS